MSTNNQSISIHTRYSWMKSHPEFKKTPDKILFRWFLWEFFKLIQYTPVINIHDCSKMQLKPGKKRGIHGLIYIFREGLEYTVRYAVERYALTGKICYDIGANIGFWTLRMSELVGETGCVYAFEPMSKNIDLLNKNIKMSNPFNKNVQVIPVALGNLECTSRLYIPIDPGSSSMAPESSKDEYEDILVKRLDDVWKSQGCPRVDFVKMDVEGSEPLILEGGEKFFQEVRPIVVCEVNSRKLNAMGKKPNDIFDKFHSWKYDSFILNLETHDLIKCHSAQDGDIIFISRI